MGPLPNPNGSTAKFSPAILQGSSSGCSQPGQRHAIVEGLINLFLSPSLRFNSLRLLLSAAISALIHELHLSHEYDGYLVVVIVAPVVFVHHLASAFGPLLAIPAILDVILSLGEIVVVAYSLHQHSASVWSSHVYLWSFTSWLSVLVMAVILTLARLMDHAVAFGKCSGIFGWLFRRYDFTRSSCASGSDQISSKDKGLRRAVQILAGERLWVPLFRGETNWVVYFRGIFTMLVVIAIIVFGVFNIILDPVRETGLRPVKDQRSVGLPRDFKITRPTVWNVVVQRRLELLDTPDSQQQSEALFSAVTVTPLWRKTEVGPPCSQDTSQTLQGQDFEAITFNCPPSRPISKRNSTQLLPLAYQYSQPDLLVSVNFTLLNISSDSLEDIPLNSVQIMLGLTAKSKDVLKRTSPTTLIPGVNLVGIANLVIRQQFAAAGLSALGLLDTFDSFLVAQMGHVWSDPRASGSSLSDIIPRGPEIGTIRISLQNTQSEYKILQEFRDKSILRGFASVGGLWTFLGGLFSALFGSSLMRFFFGTKPLSIYGLAHSFQRDRLREACITEYPQIQHEVNAPPEEHGMLKLLCNNLIDLDFLISKRNPNDRLPTRSSDKGHTNPNLKDSYELDLYGESEPIIQHMNVLAKDQVYEAKR